METVTNVFFFAFSFAQIEKEKFLNSVSMTFQNRKKNIESFTSVRRENDVKYAVARSDIVLETLTQQR